MTKERVTLFIHADLARDIQRAARDAATAEKLAKSIERSARKWLKANRPKVDSETFARRHQSVNIEDIKSRQSSLRMRRQKLCEFGKELTHTRKELGLTSAELATHVGWPHEFALAVEAGRRLLAIHRLHLLMHTLELPKQRREILETKLKEVAPFLVATNVSDKTTSNASKPDAQTMKSASLMNAEPTAKNTTANALNCMAIQHIDLSPISSAIYRSVGILPADDECTPQELREQHPQILDSQKGAYFSRQDANLRHVVEPDKSKIADPFWTALGIAVKERRNELGLRRRDVAEKTQLQSKQICRAEMGNSKTSVDDFFNIAAALDTEFGVLVKRAQELSFGSSEHFTVE